MGRNDYYSKRAGIFLEDVRRFVPSYDKMAGEIVAILQREWPDRVLDIGSGVGNIDVMILDNTAASRVDCVELSPEMARASIQTLGQHLDRARVMVKDIMDFDPQGEYDAVLSNLMMHNLEPERKGELLAKILSWLRPGGLFVWGDMVRHESREQHRMLMLERFRYALGRGADKELAKETLDKETSDHPLTAEEMMKLCTEAGFREPHCVWSAGSFAVFSMRK